MSQLVGARPDRLPVQPPQLRLAPADADREVRRADAAALESLEEALDDPVLERVERDDGNAPAWPQHLERGRKRLLELAQLVVDGDPERLEGALRRMAVPEPGRRRDRGADDVDEVAGALDRLLAASPADRTRDLLRVTLLAVLAEDRDQLALRGLVDELRGGQLRGRVHAHIERRVGCVREPSLRTVELHARDAEIEQDRVRAHAVLGQLVEYDGGLAAQEARLHARVALEAFEVRPHRRVAVDRDETAVAFEVGGEDRCMAAGPEGRVDDGLPGLDREELAHLLGEDGNVISLVWLQDARQHLLRSLRPLSVPCARRRGPRSPGGPSRPRRRRSGRALHAG